MIGRRALSVLLALLLGVQWAGATAHCLRFTSPTMEICTPEGVQHIPWPGEDGTLPGHQAASSFCAACALPTAAPVPLSVSPPRDVVYVAVAYAQPPGRAPPAPAFPPPHQPRAPPAA